MQHTYHRSPVRRRGRIPSPSLRWIIWAVVLVLVLIQVAGVLVLDLTAA